MMSRLLGARVDNTRPDSFVNGLRRRRFSLFLSLIKELPRPVKILDVGGTESFWKMMQYHDAAEVSVVLINLCATPTELSNFTSVVADGRKLNMFADHSFDIVFSNAVLEHLDVAGQRQMAAEIRRIGRGYFVQTPNRNFPLDIHFQYPLLQFFPAAIARSVRPEAAGVRLLTKAEFGRLFPDSRIATERLLGVPKSYIAYADPVLRNPLPRASSQVTVNAGL